ncbi:MAG: ATP-dependent Clp protease adaptor ClpS [Phycisphaerae bacterium]|nr:ATP-dependent Clp protease adaptor ClpS [Phycisphaerae bacterium]
MNSTTVSPAPRPTLPAPKKEKPPQRPKLYNVILLDDNDHTYDYVIGMLEKLFGYSAEQAYQLACSVDTTGRVVVETAPLERAEFKRDQIHAFGRDWRIPRCCGSMTSIVELVSN